MEISVPLPLDNDGFLRRQCPNCNAQFKWHYGPANEEAENTAGSIVYHCPLCGRPADTDRWYTGEQTGYIEAFAMPAMMRHADELFADAFKGFDSNHLTIEAPGHLDVPDEPDALVEPDDMVIITSPCHAYEPVKVPEASTDPLHCLVCGQVFAV